MVTDASALRDVALFKLLDDEDRDALAQVIDSHPLEAGQVLFHAGDPGDSLYVVRSGRIELFIKDTTGQKIVLSVAESGDLFGELAERFSDFVRVLAEISFKSLFHGDEHMLRVYTRWMYTRSERDAGWLRRHGVIPYAPASRRHH